MSMAGALSVSGLSVAYGSGPSAVHALGPMSLSLEPGGIVAVIGPSGCGKTTLLHALCGIIKNHGGSISLGGEPVDPRRHSISFVPQDFGLLPWKTVGQNCLLPHEVKKRTNAAPAHERLETLAARLGILELMDRYPSELSGGQKQRAAIARAFGMRPDLLLMDEPFSALDALARERAQDLFLEVWSRFEAATVFVTHSIEESAAVGKQILVMSQRPGTVTAMINNHCFGMEGIRLKEEYHEMVTRIRETIDIVSRR